MAIQINIQIFGTKKCQDTNKALRFFKERGIKPHFVDLAEKAVSKGELDNILRSIPLEDLIDSESKEYKNKGFAYKVFNIYEELLENPLLFKTPIVRFSSKSVVGYKPEIWKGWLV